MPLSDAIKKTPKNIKTNVDIREKTYSQTDLEYMSSLSSAVLQKSAVSTQITLWTIFLVITCTILWASFAEVDEITRGEGKVIPSSQIQVIQNLEGGIVSEIIVSEGDVVEPGDTLMRLDSIGFESSFRESRLKISELLAKQARLRSESFGTPFSVDPRLRELSPQTVSSEENLLASNMEQLESTLQGLREQLRQRQNEVKETRSKVSQLQTSLDLISEEIRITEPLVNQGIVSDVEFLKLKRQANEVEGELKTAKLSIPRIQSTLLESKKKIDETRLNFQNRAKKELNEISAEIERLEESQEVLEDRVRRTNVQSPVKGKINKLHINTIGGVIQPGMDIAEIVPLEDNLLIEAKIKPSDIAFLHPGQEAILKFSAYDFSIHGGLNGEVVNISADTIKDEQAKESFYQVRIKAERNFLGTKEKPLQILVGMTVSADILTGKKTILEYLLKPIFKAKSTALTER